MTEQRFYQFGEFRLEPEERRLFRGEHDTQLSGKPFDVLLYLVQRAGKLVRKDQLITDVWPDAIVEPGNLNVQLSKIRKVIGDNCIESVARVGYRFTATVLERSDGTAPSVTSSRNSRLWLLSWGVMPLLLG